MAPRSRPFRQIDEPRIASAFLLGSFALMLAGYGYGLTTSTSTPAASAVAAAVALAAIGFAGLLYAWRASAGGAGD